jgi:hypothetical protein
MKQLNLHEKEEEGLHNKVDLLENLLGVRVIPLIGNNYEGHNKPPQFRKLNKHVH